MTLDVVILVLGFIGLIWGAEKFVFGASAIARNLGVTPLIIGLTIVAFGTSAPEIFSSLAAVIEKEPNLAIGNVLGSNIFNIGVVLGITALINPLRPPESLFRKEIFFLLLVTLVTGVLLANLYLGFFDGVILIAIIVFIGYKLLQSRSTTELVEFTDENPLRLNNFRAIVYMVLGLALLILSADAIVEAASSIAKMAGVPSAFIGLTIIALGTSLPELATTVTSALKGHHELAIGNIVGSNIINILAILPIPALFAPLPLEPAFLSRDFLTMLLMTLVLAFFCFRAIKTKNMIGRTNGVIFLLMYGCWFTVTVFQM